MLPEKDPDNDGPPSKRTRSQVPYHQTFFADCQRNPEPTSSILSEIQAPIVRLESQDRDPAISISALLATMEAYQSLAEQVLANPIASGPQEPTSYRQAKASA